MGRPAGVLPVKTGGRGTGSGAPTGRVTAWNSPAATHRRTRWAASGQPPHSPIRTHSLGPPPFLCAATYAGTGRRTRTFAALRSSAPWRSRDASDRGRSPTSGRSRRRADVPPAVGRQHRRAARPADDAVDDRDPGLRDHGSRRSRSAWWACSRSVPLVGFGLYGGAFADAMDRRKLALVASARPVAAARWSLLVQALLALQQRRRALRVVALQSGFSRSTTRPRTRSSPRLLDGRAAPRRERAQHGVVQPRLHASGPVLGALAIKWRRLRRGVRVDAVTFTAAMYALVRLPAMPPGRARPAARARVGAWTGCASSAPRRTCG